MTKEPTLSEVKRLSQKYGVDIEIKFGSHHHAIVSDEDGGIYVKCEATDNFIEEIESKCIQIKERVETKNK